MHKVLQTSIDRFLKGQLIDDVTNSQGFEHFSNYCVVAQQCTESFDVEEIATPKDTEGIDGVAVLLDGTIILSKEDAESFFANIRGRQQVRASYIFIQSKTSESFDSGEMLKFGAGVLRLFDESGSYSETDGTLGEIQGIHSVLVENMHRIQDSRPRCHLYYVCAGTWNESNGLRKYAEQIQSVLSASSNFSNVAYEPVDRERLIRLWQQTHEPITATFAVQHYMPIPEIPGVAEAYLALVPALDFIKHALTDEDGRMRASVFEQNVRAFLGEDNRVNKKIQETLADTQTQDRFALLNNGITIVAPDVRIQSSKISVSGYQIVNGCQTSHVLFRNQQLVTSNALLPVKVIETSDPGILAQVVQATNSQTDIDETQFLSIVPFVQRLGAYFDTFEHDSEEQPRVYFERRIRQYAEEDIGRMRIFDIGRVARCFAAMFLDLPHLAARYPNQIFREQKKIFQSDHSEKAYYVAALALYRLELALGNKYVDRSHQTRKWHSLMVFRYQVGGPDLPALNSKKIDAYCDKLLVGLSAGGKASAPPFKKAMDLLDKLGISGRDRLKSQKSADDVRRHFKK